MGGHPLTGPIDFASRESQVLINPRMPTEQAERLTGWLEQIDLPENHVFVLTSGSTAVSDAQFKWVALSKPAVLAAAKGSNEHLACTPTDVWLHPLPDFHVGGVGIWTRAMLSGSEVVKLDPEGGWNATEYHRLARDSGATLSSLVPTQLHDLVAAGLESPPTMRSILVGGAALAADLYRRARELGWPVLRTYGMTETASQTATEALSVLMSTAAAEQRLDVLPHLEVGIEAESGRIQVRGSSLLSGYVSLDSSGHPHFWDPKDSNGWFTAEDLGQLENRKLRILGRTQERIKIGGETSNLAMLRQILEEVCVTLGLANGAVLLPLPDIRLETVIALVVESRVSQASREELSRMFAERVLPFERARQVLEVPEIPRTPLGKVKWAELSALVR